MNKNGVLEYPKIRALHYIEGDLSPEQHVVVQEKLDGSNVSILVRDGQFVLQSRTTIIDPTNPGMFKPFVTYVEQNKDALSTYLKEGDAIYGEMVQNQGKIQYPITQAFAIFDIGHVSPEPVPGRRADASSFDAHYIPYSYQIINELAVHIGATAAQLLWAGAWRDFPRDAKISEWINSEKSEGIVIKAYDVDMQWMDDDGTIKGHYFPILGGKVVRDDFRELATPLKNPKRSNVPLEFIAQSLVTQARVDKATRRVQENGGDWTKADQVIKAVLKDAHDEDESYIKDMMFKALWGKMGADVAKKVLELHPASVEALRT
jgi:hypothetical protein